MLEILMAYNAIIREVLNGSLFPLSLFLASMIGHYLWDIYEKSGSLNGWRRANGSQTACVLFWVFLAEGCRSGMVWFIYRIDTLHVNVATTTAGLWSTVVFIATGSILVAAILRATFLFTPIDSPYRTWYWKASAGATVFLNVVSVVTDTYDLI